MSDIQFCPVKPYGFAVSAGSRVHVYSSRSKAETKVLSKFPDTAYSGVWREDGKLVVSGCEDGAIRLYNVAARTVLRTLSGHSRAVRKVGFCGPNAHASSLLPPPPPSSSSSSSSSSAPLSSADTISSSLSSSSFSSLVYSCSDDFSARIWDVPTESPVVTFSGHTDVVRAGTMLGGSEHMLLTGSYDHSIVLWDARTGSPALTLNGDGPVEALVVLPSSSGVIVSASLNSIHVWDVLGGGKRLLSTSNHRKTITDLTVDATGSRLLSASLDQMVKVYDVADYSVTHTLKYDSGLLSVALSPDNSLLVTGGVNGELSIREYKTSGGNIVSSIASGRTNFTPLDPRGGELSLGTPKASSSSSSSSSSAAAGGGAGTSSSGGVVLKRADRVKSRPDDFDLSSRRRKKLRDYERFLKQFEYQNALDAALAKNDPVVVVSLVAELRQRLALRSALKGRDDSTLEPLMEFLIRYAVVPKYAPLLLDVASTVLEMYAPFIGQYVSLDELFVSLAQVVRREVAFLRDLHGMQGMLEPFIAPNN